MNNNLLTTTHQVNCCNFTQCRNVILLNNTFALNNPKDSIGESLHCYSASESGLKMNDKSFYRLLYGEYVRIFCSKCANDGCLKQCGYSKRWPKCTNLDVEFINGLKKGWYSKRTIVNVCKNHPICHICNIATEDRTPNKCVKCNVLFHYFDLAHYKEFVHCKPCLIETEHSNIINTIQFRVNKWNLHNFDKQIILLIISFTDDISNIKQCGGLIIPCCNKDNTCKSNIILTKTTQKNYIQRKIYNYKVTYPMEEIKPTIPTPQYYGNKPQRSRFFCVNCTENIIQKCGYKDKDCRKKESGEIHICGTHPSIICKQCNKQQFNIFHCHKCREYNCLKHCPSHIIADKYKRLSYICKPCILLDEYRNIRRIIQRCTNIQQIIANLIAEFSVGYIINCSNNKCKNQVICDNKYEFLTMKDYNGKQFMYYGIDKKFMHCRSHKLCGKNMHMKILCNECIENKNINENNEQKMNDKIICKICKKEQVKLRECQGCFEYFCNSCGCRGQCKDCVILKEIEKMKYSVSIGIGKYIKSDKIMNIISEYAIGYIINCKKCVNKVVINNQFDLECNFYNGNNYGIDGNGYKIYQYCMTDVYKLESTENEQYRWRRSYRSQTKVSFIKTFWMYNRRRIVICSSCCQQQGEWINVYDKEYVNRDIQWPINPNKYT